MRINQIDKTESTIFFCALLLVCFFLIECNEKTKKEKKIPVTVAVSKEEPIEDIIAKMISNAAADSVITDSSLSYFKALDLFYSEHQHQLVWSEKKKWKPVCDSLIRFVKQSRNEGLFPSDYHSEFLQQLKKRSADSIHASDKIYWAKADLLFTNTVFALIADMKQGRLQPDSLSWKNSGAKIKILFVPVMNKIFDSGNLSVQLHAIEPIHKAYQQLKEAIPSFVEKMDTSVYTWLRFPFKSGNEKDSLQFIRSLQKRLHEAKLMKSTDALPDSVMIADALKRYQSAKGLTVDGKFGPSVVNSLNSTDIEKFKRIAITLDQYKLLPDSMPAKHIWVNLPSYKLEVWQTDSLVLESKIICGKPTTPTPLLTGAITDIVIYPTWTVPTSIITKEMLPGLKKNSGYLTKKGLKLLDQKGAEIDASTISWQKYSKGIPYKIQQASGDDNALGVIKFNFNNPFDVYLHDTNQRYLFKNAMRALSHGCVRVQNWKGLANYIVRNDSLNVPQPDSLKYNSDSITNWIAAKERHRIYVKQKIPLYIRYFTCEGVEGKIRFYEDIYGSDKALAEKYFMNRNFNQN